MFDDGVGLDDNDEDPYDIIDFSSSPSDDLLLSASDVVKHIEDNDGLPNPFNILCGDLNTCDPLDSTESQLFSNAKSGPVNVDRVNLGSSLR